MEGCRIISGFGSKYQNRLKKIHRASLLFYSFAFEAFLNHIGAAIYKNLWTNDYENNKTIKDKTKKIFEFLDLDHQPGQYPLQKALNLMSDYRNEIVHSKSKIIPFKKEISGFIIDSQELMKSVLSDSEPHETLENLEDVKQQLEILFNQIHSEERQKTFPSMMFYLLKVWLLAQVHFKENLMSKEIAEFSDDEDDSDKDTWLIRLQKNFHPWEKYIWINKDSCYIRNSKIKFNRALYVNNNKQNNHNERHVEHLIDFIVANRSEAVKEKKEGDKPSKYHAPNEEKGCPDLIYTDAFTDLITKYTPVGYSFKRVGIYVMPTVKKKNAPYGNIEIIFTKNLTSTYSNFIYAYDSGASLNREISINLHLKPGEKTDKLEEDLLEIFDKFKISPNEVRLLESLDAENFKKLHFDTAPKSKAPYNFYLNKKSKKATEPLSPGQEDCMEEEEFVIEDSDINENQKLITECFEFLGYLEEVDNDREILVSIAKKESLTEKDIALLKNIHSKLKETSGKYLASLEDESSDITPSYK